MVFFYASFSLALAIWEDLKALEKSWGELEKGGRLLRKPAVSLDHTNALLQVWEGKQPHCIRQGHPVRS